MTELAYLTLSQASNLIRVRKLSPVEYAQSLIRRTEVLDGRLHAYIRTCRSPSSLRRDRCGADGIKPHPPCRIDDAEACARAYPRHARQAFNVTGQPAIAIPAGFTKAGLPLSIQLVGHYFREAMVYRVASAYEAATRWVEQHPPGLQDAHTSR